MIDILILLLVPALKALSDPRKYWYLLWAPIPAWIADLIAAHTTWRLVAGPLHSGERTISDSLERLYNDSSNPDHALFVAISHKINNASGLPHIKAAATCLK